MVALACCSKSNANFNAIDVFTQEEQPIDILFVYDCSFVPAGTFIRFDYIVSVVGDAETATGDWAVATASSMNAVDGITAFGLSFFQKTEERLTTFDEMPVRLHAGRDTWVIRYDRNSDLLKLNTELRTPGSIKQVWLSHDALINAQCHDALGQ